MQHALVLLVGLALMLPVQAIEQTKAVKVSTVLKPKPAGTDSRCNIRRGTPK